MRQRLAEADAGIQPDTLAPNPRFEGELGLRHQRIPNLGHDVAIAGIGLHGARLALHVHQHDLAAQFGGDYRTVGICAQCADIVPHCGSDRDRCTGHGGLERVDADGAFPSGAKAGDDRQDPRELLGLIDRIGARPGAFAADVQNVRALLDQSQAVGDRGLDRPQPATVREAVGRDVDDAHHAGAVHPAPPIRPPNASR